MLVNFYNRLHEKYGDPQLEIIFVSRDKDDAQFQKYFKTMPWLAVPYNDKRIITFQKQFNISSLPTLVVLGCHGEKVTMRGKEEVVFEGLSAYESWISVEFDDPKDNANEGDEQEDSL
jgi:nucleoredoxin